MNVNSDGTSFPRSLAATAPAVAATALIGALGTDVRSDWYAALEKPSWQPPGELFGPVWTALYASIAVASARTVSQLSARERRGYGGALGANLALNAGWNWLFFRARRPRLAVVEILGLEVSTIDLVRRSWRVDRGAGGALVPYAAWVGFASLLTTWIARNND